MNAVAEDANAVLKINGNEVSSLPLSLNEGANTYTISVSSQDGTQSESYTLTITVVNDEVEDPSNLEIQNLTTSVGKVVVLSNGNYVIQYPEGTAKLNVNVVANDPSARVEIYAKSPYSDLPLNPVPYTSGQDIPISDAVTKLSIVLKTATDQKSYEVALLSYSVSDRDYIKFGGDINLSINKYDFQDTTLDNLLTTVNTTKDKITFHLDFSADITVNAIYGTEDVGEVRVLTNGYTRIAFTSSKIEKDGTPIVLQITDNTTGTSRYYVIKVVKYNFFQLILIIALSVMVVLVIILGITVCIKLRRNRK